MSQSERSTTSPARSGSKRFVRAALVVLAMAMVPAVAVWSVARGQPTTPPPDYTSDGQLKLPVEFQKWIFVGSNLGLEYNEGPQRGVESFHNVYINPEAYRHFLDKKEFPDKTVLVMDIYEPATRDPVLAKGKYNGPRRGLEVAVKNAARPGNVPTDWAYYAFAVNAAGAVAPSAKAFDQICYDCHKTHASTDNVWVQFYPVLRDRPPQ